MIFLFMLVEMSMVSIEIQVNQVLLPLHLSWQIRVLHEQILIYPINFKRHV